MGCGCLRCFLHGACRWCCLLTVASWTWHHLCLSHAIARPLMMQAAAQLATRLAAASPSAAAALADSALVGSLTALLEAPSVEISPNAKWDALGFFRQVARRPAVREAVSACLNRGRVTAVECACTQSHVACTHVLVQSCASATRPASLAVPPCLLPACTKAEPAS